MLNVSPFLLFDGKCAEAMTFYQSCLGGELTITRISDTPMKEQMPPHQLHKVAYANLKSGAIVLTATDWLHPTRTPKQGNTVAICINDGTYDELKVIFDKLSIGADESLLDPLRDMPFGTYGHLADVFGIHWFFQGKHQS
jgi:PhnB protein